MTEKAMAVAGPPALVWLFGDLPPITETMSIDTRIKNLRSWFPIPFGPRGVNIRSWILLEANRLAVTGALLTLTIVTILALGTAWTIEVHVLLTETQAVQTVLNTLMSGIILLVSIVVSINSIVLSYDLTDVSAQRERIEGTREFHLALDRFADANRDPTDPQTFLQVMAQSIQQRAKKLKSITEGADEELAQDIEEHARVVAETVGQLETEIDSGRGGDFGVLWLGLQADYGPMINESRKLSNRYRDAFSEEHEEVIDELVEALELFATGREYFKTLYYSREAADLSRTLLVVSLPSILVTTLTILAINANMLPEVWLFGLPPLLTFVAISFTIALMPFIVLTAYMLRMATVARRTAGGGPFGLDS